MDTKNRIKELMDERGWTIYELSKRSGLAQTTISNMWKRNTSQPFLLSVLFAMVSALHYRSSLPKEIWLN